MPTFYLSIEEQLSILEKLQQKANSVLKSSPPGQLTVQKCGSYTQFLYRPAGENASRQFIRRENQDFAKSLAQKAYTISFIKAASRQAEELKKLSSSASPRSASLMYHALARPFEKLTPERQALVTPYVLPDDLYIQSFLATEYEKKGFFDGAPVILTENGERVRSKSEKIIADKLSSMGIPYLYECPLYLKKIGWIHPDFTLLDVRERTTVILEHFGLMQDLSYVAQAMRKVDCYIYDGYVPGDRLLITHEGGTQVLDHESLDLLISHRFSS